MRIIIADDEVVFRLLLQKQLEKCGHEVVVCSDGAAAWEVLSQEDPPQLAILDWMMPGLSGIDICRKLRALAQGDQIYVLLVSARQSTEDIVEGLRAGANDYLTKPVEPAELEARIGVAIRLIEMQSKVINQLSFTQALVDSIPNPVFVMGADKRFANFNRAYEYAFGIQRANYIGKTVLDLDHIAQSDREQFQDAHTALLASGDSSHKEINLTYMDGKVHTVLYWVAAFDNPKGERAGLLGMFVDISEQKRLEHHLQSALSMASPISRIWKDVLLLPIVGVVDADRAQRIMSTSLSAIAENRAKYLIIDISGVANLDAQVASSILKVARAAQLMGCTGLVSGVSPNIAQTFVDLEIDLGAAMTMTSLGDAVAHVMKHVREVG